MAGPSLLIIGATARDERGNALLSKLWESHQYRVLPFPGGRGAGEIIEVYPRATLRTMGLASYKSKPTKRCVLASPRAPPPASS